MHHRPLHPCFPDSTVHRKFWQKALNISAAVSGGNPARNPKGTALARTPTLRLTAAPTLAAAWGCPDLSPRVLPALGRRSLGIPGKPAKHTPFARMPADSMEQGTRYMGQPSFWWSVKALRACGMPTVPAGTAPAQQGPPQLFPCTQGDDEAAACSTVPSQPRKFY